MCSPAVCGRCGKITWSGCGQHADQVLARRLGIHLHRLSCALLVAVDLSAAGLLTGSLS